MKLEFAPYQRCVQRMGPGQVKRFTARDRLFGFTISCPSCGAAFTYSAEKFGITEGEWTITPRPLEAKRRASTEEEAPFVGQIVNVYHPTHVTAAKPMPCVRCGLEIHIVDDQIWAAPAAGGAPA